jgi:hypothetical protein
MDEDHSWLYNIWDKNGAHSDEWVTKTTTFLDRAFTFSKINKVWCPCSKWHNLRSLHKDMVALDLCRNGFVPHYEVWVFHDESVTQAIEEEEEDYSTTVDKIDEMLEAIQQEFTNDPPTMEVKAFFELLKASEEPLHAHTEKTLFAFMT